MNTIAKGNAAEAAVLSAFVKMGELVLIPFSEGHPYDLMVDLGAGSPLRVQCKAARERRGCITFNCRSTDHGRGRLSYLGRADIFGVYFAVTDSVYLVPVAEETGFEVNLRIKPTRNNQRRLVRHAEHYAVERWSHERLSAVASASAPRAA